MRNMEIRMCNFNFHDEASGLSLMTGPRKSYCVAATAF